MGKENKAKILFLRETDRQGHIVGQTGKQTEKKRLRQEEKKTIEEKKEKEVP